jgi:hypothetical protein
MIIRVGKNKLEHKRLCDKLLSFTISEMIARTFSTPGYFRVGHGFRVSFAIYSNTNEDINTKIHTYIHIYELVT